MELHFMEADPWQVWQSGKNCSVSSTWRPGISSSWLRRPGCTPALNRKSTLFPSKSQSELEQASSAVKYCSARLLMLAARQLLCVKASVLTGGSGPRKPSSTAALVSQLQWLKPGSEFIKWLIQLSWEWPRDTNRYDTKRSVTEFHPWQSASVLSFQEEEWIIGLTLKLLLFWFTLGLLHLKRRIVLQEGEAIKLFWSHPVNGRGTVCLYWFIFITHSQVEKRWSK